MSDADNQHILFICENVNMKCIYFWDIRGSHRDEVEYSGFWGVGLCGGGGATDPTTRCHLPEDICCPDVQVMDKAEA
jgi:hypothetical protein